MRARERARTQDGAKSRSRGSSPLPETPREARR